MVCAQDDGKLRIVALLVDTPGYDQLMLSKSAAAQPVQDAPDAKGVQLESQPAPATHFDNRIQLIVSERARKLNEQLEQVEEQGRWLQEQNKLVSEGETKLQEQMEEQRRELQEQNEFVNVVNERDRKLQEQNERLRDRERELQKQMEEQRRELQKQVDRLKRQLNDTKPMQ